MKTLSEIEKEIEARTERSAWARGVKAYALELLEDAIENNGAEHCYNDRQEARKDLLNGADSWHDYSWGGSALIYDGDIAERLCTPSAYKHSNGGDRKPNRDEEWLDTQARALYQASRLIVGTAL
ncbi:MAG: hypothetical protein RR338_03015 [Clostridia bacterium]